MQIKPNLTFPTDHTQTIVKYVHFKDPLEID